MENYTKYRLKNNDELASVLAGKDNLFSLPVTSVSRNLKQSMNRNAPSLKNSPQSRGRQLQVLQELIFYATKSRQRKNSRI